MIKLLLLVAAVITATPLFAADSTDTAANGLAGLFGFLSLFGIVYAILFALVTVHRLVLLRQANRHQNDILGLRKILRRIRLVPEAGPELARAFSSKFVNTSAFKNNRFIASLATTLPN
jgi:hypothetical protein